MPVLLQRSQEVGRSLKALQKSSNDVSQYHSSMASSSYSVGDVEVAFTDILPPENEEGKWHYRGLRDGKATLKKGEQVLEGSLPLPCDMIVERDVPVTLRDGVRIRVDVHRPVASQPVPAVICYSPYGKGGSGALTRDRPRSLCLHQSSLTPRTGYPNLEWWGGAAWLIKLTIVQASIPSWYSSKRSFGSRKIRRN